MKLFNAEVRPILEYACQFWAPLINKDQARRLEAVQGAFLSWALDVPHISSATVRSVARVPKIVTRLTFNALRFWDRLRMQNQETSLAAKLFAHREAVRDSLSRPVTHSWNTKIQPWVCSFLPQDGVIKNKADIRVLQEAAALQDWLSDTEIARKRNSILAKSNAGWAPWNITQIPQIPFFLSNTCKLDWRSCVLRLTLDTLPTLSLSFAVFKLDQRQAICPFCCKQPDSAIHFVYQCEYWSSLRIGIYYKAYIKLEYTSRVIEHAHRIHYKSDTLENPFVADFLR